MDIVYLMEGQGGCAWYRCRVPGEALAGIGHRVEFHTRPPSPDRLAVADVVVLQRPSHPVHVSIAEWMGGQRGRLVTELDDDFWTLHPTNPAVRHWGRPGVLEALETCIRRSDLVTVTTPGLAASVRRFNQKVEILPNMLPASAWPAQRKPLPDGEAVRIGWAGTATHLVDLKILSGVVESVLGKYESAEFLFAGMPELPFAPHERIRTLPPVSIDEYATLVAEFDIGLAPVLDSAFNRCKSDLKFLEYAMAGLPVVASRVGSYESTVEHGMTGLLASNTKDWLKYISRLVADPGERDRIAKNARAYSETRTIGRNVGLWDAAYSNLVS